MALLLLPIKAILQVRIIEFMPEQENEIPVEKDMREKNAETE